MGHSSLSDWIPVGDFSRRYILGHYNITSFTTLPLVLWHINWFISVQTCNLRNSQRTFLQMRDGDVFFGDCKKFVFSIVLFSSSCFGTVLRYRRLCTFSLNVGTPRWRPWTWWWCRSDWEKFLWIWGGFVLQPTECKSLPGLKIKNRFEDLVSSAPETHRSLSWTTLCRVETEDKLNSTTWTRFHCSCLVSLLLRQSYFNASCFSGYRCVLLWFN